LNAKNTGAARKIWDFFCSLKLTIFTLILLAATSIIGTVIQQDKPAETYIRQYGETTYLFLDSLQLFDMYHSWWFLGLLCLFTANLTACTINRLPYTLRAVRNRNRTPDEGHFKTLSDKAELHSPQPCGPIAEKLRGIFASRFAGAELTEKDGKQYLYAEKGAWSRSGVYITHLSIIIIFVGAIIGNVFGYKGYVNIVEGQSVNEVWNRSTKAPEKLDFSLRCDDFSVSYYEGSSRPKEFKSLITLIDGDRIIEEKRPVIVNDPITYKGITFYQSSYGPAGDPTLSLRVTDNATGKSRQMQIAMNKPVKVEGGSFQVQAYTPSYEQFGPAVRMSFTPDGGAPSTFILMQNYPDFDKRRGGPYSFALLDYDELRYTGLQVNKDPGVWVVWIGCILMILGCYIAFLCSHRKLWAVVEPSAKGSRVLIGGSTHRNKPAFTLYFDELEKELRKELGC